MKWLKKINNLCFVGSLTFLYLYYTIISFWYTWFLVPSWMIALRKFNFVSTLPIIVSVKWFNQWVFYFSCCGLIQLCFSLDSQYPQMFLIDVLYFIWCFCVWCRCNKQQIYLSCLHRIHWKKYSHTHTIQFNKC